MVTGVTGETRQHPHMTQEEIPYCSTSTTSGKQKKARSTSQPQLSKSDNLKVCRLFFLQLSTILFQPPHM